MAISLGHRSKVRKHRSKEEEQSLTLPKKRDAPRKAEASLAVPTKQKRIQKAMIRGELREKWR